MANYTVQDTQTGKTITFEWNGDQPPTDSDYEQVFSAARDQFSNTKVVGNPDASPEETEQLRRDFIRKEGTPGRRANERLKSMADFSEVPRFIGDTGVMFANALGKGLKSTASLVQGGGEAIRQGSIDAGLRKYAQKQAEFQPVEAHWKPSGASEWIGDTINSGINYLGKKTGRPDIVEPIAQGAMDIAALAGIGKMSKGVRLSDIGNTVLPLKTVGKVADATASRLTDMTLKQGTTLKPEIRRQNVKTALEGRYLPNKKGVDKLATDIAKKEKDISMGVAAGDKLQIAGTLDRSIANVEALRAEANRSADPIKNNKLIDDEIENLRNSPMGKQIPVGEMQKAKVEQGRAIKYQGKLNQAVDPFKTKIDKARVRGMREELEVRLADVFPELKENNAQLSKYYKLQDVLERASNRIEQNQGIGIALPIKSGAGATIGGMIGGAPGAAVGGTIGTMIGIVEHPSVAPRLAQMLYWSRKGKVSMERARGIVDERLSKLTDSIAKESMGGLPPNLSIKLGVDQFNGKFGETYQDILNRYGINSNELMDMTKGFIGKDGEFITPDLIRQELDRRGVKF